MFLRHESEVIHIGSTLPLFTNMHMHAHEYANFVSEGVSHDG